MSIALEEPQSKTRVTPEDLLALEEEGLFELVDGKLVEKAMSSLASKTAGIVTSRLLTWAEAGSTGDIFPEQTFKCFPNDPERIRRPDVAFIAAAKLALVEEEGHVTVVPDLAVEVLSPNDKIADFEEKLIDYWSAGVKEVWAVHPTFRWIHVHRPGQSILELRDGDILTGDPVLPGFSVCVREMLPKRQDIAT